MTLEALYNEQMKYDEGSMEYKALQDKIDAYVSVVRKLQELKDAYVRFSATDNLLNVAVKKDYISAFALDDNDKYMFKYDEVR